MGLFPRDATFFTKFNEQTENISDISAVLLQIIQADRIDPLWATRLSESENRGDRIAKELIHRAQSTFVTPIDREDIFALAHTIDDVLDYIEEAVVRIVAYGMIGDKDINTFIGIMREAIMWMGEGVAQLKIAESERTNEITEKIIECEHAADELIRSVIAKSYDISVSTVLNGISAAVPLTVIELQRIIDFYNYKRKKREIAEILEKAVDACRHVFHTIGNIRLKQ